MAILTPRLGEKVVWLLYEGIKLKFYALKSLFSFFKVAINPSRGWVREGEKRCSKKIELGNGRPKTGLLCRGAGDAW